MTSQSNERRYSLITLMSMIAHAMVDELIIRLAAAGYADVGSTDQHVFENIERGGTRLTVLAARAQITHQSMSELVKYLEARGYLERQIDASDRRARLVLLTPKGRTMLRYAFLEIEDIEAGWIKRIGPIQGQNLHSCLEQALRSSELLPEF